MRLFKSTVGGILVRFFARQHMYSVVMNILGLWRRRLSHRRAGGRNIACVVRGTDG